MFIVIFGVSVLLLSVIGVVLAGGGPRKDPDPGKDPGEDPNAFRMGNVYQIKYFDKYDRGPNNSDKSGGWDTREGWSKLRHHVDKDVSVVVAIGGYHRTDVWKVLRPVIDIIKDLFEGKSIDDILKEIGTKAKDSYVDQGSPPGWSLDIQYRALVVTFWIAQRIIDDRKGVLTTIAKTNPDVYPFLSPEYDDKAGFQVVRLARLYENMSLKDALPL